MKKKTILITGANGFIACKIAEQLRHHEEEIYYTSQSPLTNPFASAHSFLQLNLLTEYERLHSWMKEIKPTHIIHTAAMTQVNACEENMEACVELNVEVPQKLAEFCAENDIHLIHFSTDFVFEGKPGKAYTEDAAVNPCNLYGKSKALSESAIISSSCSFSILRIVLVYGKAIGSQKSNFVLWVKDTLSKRKSIQAVHDHYRMPTWVDDIAETVEVLITSPVKGIFHIVGETYLSVFDFAKEIAAFWTLDEDLIQPISAEEIGQKDNRPESTRLDYSFTKNKIGFTPTPLKKAFKKIKQQLKDEEHEK